MTVAAEIGAIKPRSLSVTPQQFAALAVIENCMAALDFAAKQATALNAPMLAEGVRAAMKALQDAHSGFVESAQRSVHVASPADVPRLVAP